MYKLFGGAIRPTSRNDKAYVRVATAMWRISKNRYLPPPEVRRIALCLSRRASRASNWQTTAYRVMGTAEHVGMYQGMPILIEGAAWRLIRAFEKIENKKQIKPLDYELTVLEVLCNIR